MDRAPENCTCDRCVANGRASGTPIEPAGVQGDRLLSPTADLHARQSSVWEQRAAEAEEAGNLSQAAWFRKLAARQVSRGGLAEYKQRQADRHEREARIR